MNVVLIVGCRALILENLLTNDYLLRSFDNVKIRKHLFTITSNKNLVKHKNYRHNVNYYKNHAKGLPSINALFSLGAPTS